MPSACTQRLMVHADKNTAVILYTVYAFQECELTGMTVHYAGLMLVQPQSQLIDTPLITGQHTFGLFTILAETVGIVHVPSVESLRHAPVVNLVQIPDSYGLARLIT